MVLNRFWRDGGFQVYRHWQLCCSHDNCLAECELNLWITGMCHPCDGDGENVYACKWLNATLISCVSVAVTVRKHTFPWATPTIIMSLECWVPSQMYTAQFVRPQGKNNQTKAQNEREPSNVTNRASLQVISKRHSLRCKQQDPHPAVVTHEVATPTILLNLHATFSEIHACIC